MAKTLSARRRLLAVLIGGFLGTVARFLLSQAIQGWLGKGWPYDILTINLTGALVFALITTLAETTVLIGPTRRLLISTGFLGAYTTFSSLALGDILLFSNGSWIPALLYLFLSLCGGLCAVLGGDWLGQKLIQQIRRRGKQAHLLQAHRELTGSLASPQEPLLVEHPDVFEPRIP